MTTFTLQLESRDKIVLVTLWTDIMTSYPFFHKVFILRGALVAVFADIIKVKTMFIKTILKDSRKVRRIRNYVWNLYLYLLK